MEQICFIFARVVIWVTFVVRLLQEEFEDVGEVCLVLRENV
jgi:hypothetical protein